MAVHYLSGSTDYRTSPTIFDIMSRLGDTRGDESPGRRYRLASEYYFPAKSISDTSEYTSLIGHSKRNEKDEKEIRIY